MGSIKDSAEAYEPPQTKNISELKSIPVDIEVKDETFTKKDSDETFDVKVIEVGEEKYRVPASVLKGLKAVLEAKPETKSFQVVKSGEGMNTSYQVVPLE